jgi:hypothetical protein
LEQGERILESVEPNALVIGWWESTPFLQYLQLIEGKRPDVLVINRFNVAQGEIVKLIDRAILTLPVYSAIKDPVLAAHYKLVSSGTVYRLKKR